MEILSFSSFGYEGELIKVEADLRRGLPVIDIVGLPGSAVKEARDRMRAAIRNSGLEFPVSRILINLSPADQKKEGSGFDLPIAIAVLTAKEAEKNSAEVKAKAQTMIPRDEGREKESVMIMGELELSGRVRPVRGLIGAISAARSQGIKYFIVPKENEAEALIEDGINVFGVSDLIEALEFFYKIENGKFNTKSQGLKKESVPDKEAAPIFVWSDTEKPENFDFQKDSKIGLGLVKGFEDIRGQDGLIRALEIAAAGGHNLIAYGPPGCGKTLSLSRFPLLLPDMDEKTAMETTRIYSIAGLLPQSSPRLLKRPPFRMPSQNASMEGIIGGAGKCMPGEVSLAHGGVLFLDEAAQFKASVLQSLRAPLETGSVTLSRAGRSSTFPARFQLLLAINPCPCGNFGSHGKVCTCLPYEIEKYWKKLTAPLLDRIDIRVPVMPPKPENILAEAKYSTQTMREKIKNARLIQWERLKFTNKEKKVQNIIYENAKLSPQETAEVCKMSGEAERFFSVIVNSKKLSGRGSHALLKISRTIADIESSKNISLAHIEEAAALRQWIKYLPDFL
ncbi:YifB family Mg chelatase-like AAA ATPase [Treponema denticola]|uniref:YifB family Mg chelatase-like AAA ATPase n=1 Tax=Treponema denticola TaxID=158 RepID=UPI0020A4AF23|nr:YifB family Mg chelatase-like AAA ATPase [Treponema denticola]UTC92327.1 YifB family Mg chelatase-like AAA ATPase [Treponema denticola]UTC97406.1 YifB family Mg chelatase-like AAA ATPase [Treponema denticola]